MFHVEWPWIWIPKVVRRPLYGDGTWPFTAYVRGGDIVVEDVVITCFGGADDPEDNGETASGINTKYSPNVQGVSLPMDGRQFPEMSPAEHKALDGSPIPRLPWHTLVEVTIGDRTFMPGSGVIDLGPGKGSSEEGEPHAFDLTVAAAQFFAPNVSPRKLATTFYARGSYRILDAARFVGSAGQM